MVEAIVDGYLKGGNWGVRGCGKFWALLRGFDEIVFTDGIVLLLQG